MNVTFSAKEFLKELEYLVKVMANKPTLPILNNILIQAIDGGMRLAATRLELGLLTFCPGNTIEEGDVTLPAKHLLDVLKLMPDREISLVEEDRAIKLTAGKYVSRIPTQPASSYPSLPSLVGLPTVALSPTLPQMIKNVRFAISDKNKKYFMNGALLSGTTLVSTDGHRLALMLAPEGSAALEDPIIVPSKALDMLVDINPSETLFALGQSHMFFVVDGRLLFSGRVDGTFPNHERIMPRDTDHLVGLPRLPFEEAIRRIVLTSPSVTFQFARGVLTLTGKSTDIGEAFEQVDVVYDGEPASLMLSGEYLLDFLSAATQHSLSMAWKGNGAVLFADGQQYVYVQMPMRGA